MAIDKKAAQKESRQKSDMATYVGQQIMAYSKSQGVPLAFRLKVDFVREGQLPSGLCERECAIVLGEKEHPLTLKQAFSAIIAADANGKIAFRRQTDCDQSIAVEWLQTLEKQDYIQWPDSA